MKLRGKEDVDSLMTQVYLAGLRGAIYGGTISFALYMFVKLRAPGFLENKSGFVRSMLFVAPPAFCAITNMEFGRDAFERTRH